MTDLFFYGTLCYSPLLELVLGRPSENIDITPAVLPEHAVHAVQDQVFPMIVPSPGQDANGVFVRGLSPEDIDRLVFYEGGFDYDLQPMNVRFSDGSNTKAQVFFPEAGLWQPGKLWSIQDWAEEWGEITLLSADEVMAHYGRVDAKAIVRSFPAIRTRAWAKVAAKERISVDSRNTSEDVIVHRHDRVYIDYFGMEEIDLQHRQHDGSMGPILRRNGLMQGSAVVVLPYDPLRDTVLLIEQFRPPVFLIEDPEPWMWEPVAGMIDPGESPQAAARRETMEEARIELDALEFAGGAYSSSGSSTEYVHLFVGLGDLAKTVENGGVKAEGEDIRSQILPFSEFMAMVDGHAFKDLPLLSLAHWLARHRDKLRAAN